MTYKSVLHKCYELLFDFSFSEPRQHLIFLGKYICVKWCFVPPSAYVTVNRFLRLKMPCSQLRTCWISLCEQLIIFEILALNRIVKYLTVYA